MLDLTQEENCATAETRQTHTYSELLAMNNVVMPMADLRASLTTQQQQHNTEVLILDQFHTPESGDEYHPLNRLWNGLGTMLLVAIPTSPDKVRIITDVKMMQELPGETPVYAIFGHPSAFCTNNELNMRLYDSTQYHTHLFNSLCTTFLPLKPRTAQGTSRQEKLLEIWDQAFLVLGKEGRRQLILEILRGMKTDSFIRKSTTYDEKAKLAACVDFLGGSKSLNRQSRRKITTTINWATEGVNIPTKIRENHHLIGVVTATLAMLRCEQATPLCEGVFTPVEIYQATLNLKRIAESKLRRQFISDAEQGLSYGGIDPMVLQIFQMFEDGTLQEESQAWGLSPDDKYRMNQLIKLPLFGSQTRSLQIYRRMVWPLEDGYEPIHAFLVQLMDYMQTTNISSDSNIYSRFVRAGACLKKIDLNSLYQLKLLRDSYRSKSKVETSVLELGVSRRNLSYLFSIIDRYMIDQVDIETAIHVPSGTSSPIKGATISKLVAKVSEIADSYPRILDLVPAQLLELINTARSIQELERDATNGDNLLGRAAEKLGYEKSSIVIKVRRFSYVISYLERILGFRTAPGEEVEQQATASNLLLQSLTFMRFSERLSREYSEMRIKEVGRNY